MRADDADRSATPPPHSGLPEKSFLGPEFLTWLFFHLEEENWELEAKDAFPDPQTQPQDGIVSFAMGRKTVLQTLDATGSKVSLSGPELDKRGELLQAIHQGALFETLELQMAISNRVYQYTLRGQDGGISQVKFPDMYTESSDDIGADGATGGSRKRQLPAEDLLALRMICLDELESVIDLLFTRFLTRRLAQAWQKQDLFSMRRRVAKGLAASVKTD
jgi:hypothetical protein